MEDNGFSYRVTNIVCKAKLPFGPDILALAFSDVCDIRTKFSGGKKRMWHSTCIVFETGSLLSLGATRTQDAQHDLEIFMISICNALCKNHCILDCVTVNCVGTFCLDRAALNLPSFYAYLQSRNFVCYYQPEQLAKLIVKIEGATVLLSHTGRGIIARGHSQEDYIPGVLEELRNLYHCV